MYLAPDGDEAELANAAGAFLAQALPISRLHRPASADLSPADCRLLGEMGWFGLAVPEEMGGSGLSAVEHALFFREAGRQCAPVDLLAQALAAQVAGDPALRAALIAGTSGAALLVADGAGHRLIGRPDAEWALLADEHGAQLFALGELAVTARPALDPANSLGTVAALTAPAHRSGSGEIWRLGQLGTAAMLVGLAEAALDLIIDYAKLRETFGRKIGAWQAVRHPCADMAVRADAARAQLWFAAAAMKEGRGDAGAHLDAAKHLAGQAAVANADTNIQLHGGIGVTDEYDAHLLLKHALLLSRLFGSKRALLAGLLHAELED